MTAPDRPELSPDMGTAPPVLHRDGMMLVIDKPAGMPVHPGPQAAGPRLATLTAHLEALRFGLPRNPEAAHRLDKDTSGCLILGRHPRATRQLNELFRDGRIGKTYWAVVEGAPEMEEGLIDMALSKRSPERGWWMKPDEDGLPAQTTFRVRGRGDGLAWLELSPLTGRTHQLRVHCAASGFPILGDTIYGTAPRFGGPGLHLHARSVSVPLNPKRDAIVVSAPVPAAMRAGFMRAGAAPDALL